jgi:chaperonin cofactor prefoldin
MKEKLEARKAAVEKEQADLSKHFEELKEKGADINRQVSAIQARFNGNVRVLNEISELMKEEAPSEAPEA